MQKMLLPAHTHTHTQFIWPFVHLLACLHAFFIVHIVSKLKFVAIFALSLCVRVFTCIHSVFSLFSYTVSFLFCWFAVKFMYTNKIKKLNEWNFIAPYWILNISVKHTLSHKFCCLFTLAISSHCIRWYSFFWFVELF